MRKDELKEEKDILNELLNAVMDVSKHAAGFGIGVAVKGLVTQSIGCDASKLRDICETVSLVTDKLDEAETILRHQLHTLN
ncbi:MAG TPA: hypothetical protein DD632_02995 [Oribacterium sp.]|nr:hypothetical protein [Oribacterium sp.]